MLNMLRMDLRRMFRVKMMFIAFFCLSAAILISIITLRTVTDPELRQQAIDAGVDITSGDQADFDAIRSLTETQALCTTIYSGGFIYVALYIIVVLFVCNDYSSGFAKNIFSFYGGRWCYYVSKLLCMTIVCALWILGSFLVFRICSLVSGMDFATSGQADYLRVFVEYLFIGVAFSAQGIFLSVWLRSEGGGIAAAIVLGGGIVPVMLEAFLGNWGISIIYKTLYGSIQAVTANVTSGSPVGGAMIVTAVWLAVWSALSLLTLYKKDV